MLVTLPSPIPKLQHAPLPFKVLRARERALTLCFSAVFSLDSHLSPLRSLGVRQCSVTKKERDPKHRSEPPRDLTLTEWGLDEHDSQKCHTIAQTDGRTQSVYCKEKGSSSELLQTQLLHKMSRTQITEFAHHTNFPSKPQIASQTFNTLTYTLYS
jgi:hypothetical protein